MANPEHLSELRKGIESWNQWREKNPTIRPTLTGVDLSSIALGEPKSNRNYALGPNFSMYFSGTDLSRVNFSKTNLSRANLERVNLSGADLSGADLSRVNLSKANLSSANLSKANLSGADLSSAELFRANLSRANLGQTRLKKANLTDANLKQAIALGANFAEATLTGACIEDWTINSETILLDVTCDHIYLKGEWSITEGWQLAERRPREDNFALGEFLALLQSSLEIVDLVFVEGIDWQAFYRALQQLQKQYGKESLYVQALEKKAGDAFIIRLNVPPQIDKADIEHRLRELYGLEMMILQEGIDLKGESLSFYREQIEKARQQSADLGVIMSTLADSHAQVQASIQESLRINSPQAPS